MYEKAKCKLLVNLRLLYILINIAPWISVRLYIKQGLTKKFY